MEYGRLLRLLAFSVSGVIAAAGSHGARAQQPETPIRTTLCLIRRDPAAFEHKLVEVTATASHGFQNSGLSDPACPWAQDRGTAFWFEYGGLVTTGTRYSEGTAAPSRPVPLTVDGIVIPLMEDEPFRLFDKRLHDPYPNRGGIVSVDATVIARVFARRMDDRLSGIRFWGGYGHLGCCVLLAVQQIVAVGPGP